MTIYYDGGRHGLVACRFLGWRKTPLHSTTGQYNAVVRLSRSSGCYACGDVLNVPEWAIVVKVCRRMGIQRIRTAALPERTDENTLPDIQYV